MLTHKCKDGDMPYVCRYCGLKFNVVNSYKKHITRVHAPKQAKSQYISPVNNSIMESDINICENNCTQDIDASLEQVRHSVHQVTNSMQLNRSLSFTNGAMGDHQTKTSTNGGKLECASTTVQSVAESVILP